MMLSVTSELTDCVFRFGITSVFPSFSVFRKDVTKCSSWCNFQILHDLAFQASFFPCPFLYNPVTCESVWCLMSQCHYCCKWGQNLFHDYWNSRPAFGFQVCRETCRVTHHNTYRHAQTPTCFQTASVELYKSCICRQQAQVQAVKPETRCKRLLCSTHMGPVCGEGKLVSVFCNMSHTVGPQVHQEVITCWLCFSI